MKAYTRDELEAKIAFRIAADYRTGEFQLWVTDHIRSALLCAIDSVSPCGVPEIVEMTVAQYEARPQPAVDASHVYLVELENEQGLFEPQDGDRVRILPYNTSRWLWTRYKPVGAEKLHVHVLLTLLPPTAGTDLVKFDPEYLVLQAMSVLYERYIELGSISEVANAQALMTLHRQAAAVRLLNIQRQQGVLQPPPPSMPQPRDNTP